MGVGHPESPQRLDAINDQMLASGIMGFLEEREPLPATEKDILRVHTAEYLEYLQAHSPSSGIYLLDADTLMNPHTFMAAKAAAGAGLTAVDAVMCGQASRAFCAVRPPGHHARPGAAMGFCLFNNVAVAAAYALEKYRLQRVAIIDFDVHHGNGTEEMFAGDPRVLMCSFYQYPLFPGRGIEPPPENMVNVPVAPYTEGAALRKIVTERWIPRLDAFQPQLVFISAGFDGHREDDMGQLGLVEADFAWITQQMGEVAERWAEGRVISLLEGGYDMSALGRSVVAHVKALAKL
jgi:acetoin utilization deacetylase AcuC-like enzyme